MSLPYEKFVTLGPESLSEAELLAIIIRTGTKEKTSVQIGEEILERSKDGILGIWHLSVEELMQIKGIGQVKAIKLKCVAELSRRIWNSRRRESLKFSSPYSVAQYYMESLRHEEKEQVILLSLNTKCELIRETLLSVGTVNLSLISPREVFLQALNDKAVNIMLLHNHPSGDPTPSEADLQITRRIKEIGGMLNIALLDHIIIGDKRYVSLLELQQL